MDEIKTNNCNMKKLSDKKGSYRLGDTLLVYKDSDYSNHYLMTDVNFKGTILGRFAEKITDKKGDRIKICAEVIKEMTREKLYSLPEKNELVIHLRLGDVFFLPPDKLSLKNKQPNMKQILKFILTKKFKKITFVTAYIYGKGNYSLPECVKKGQENSEKFLKTLISKIPENIEYSFKSSDNVDEDFIFLVTANNLFVTGESRFSEAARLVNDKYKKL